MSELSEKLGIAGYRGAYVCTVIRLVGPLDGPGGIRLIEEAERVDAGSGDRVIVHLDDVTTVDDAGIRARLEVEALDSARDGNFAISVPDPGVRGHLERAGLIAARLVVLACRHRPRHPCDRRPERSMRRRRRSSPLQLHPAIVCGNGSSTSTSVR